MPRTMRIDTRVVYPIQLPAVYEVQDAERLAGKARTVAINSEVVRFVCNRDLRIGVTVRLAVAWPVALPNGTQLNLWIFGRVAQSRASTVEVRIGTYEFKTRRSARSANVALPMPSIPRLQRAVGV